MIEMSSVKTEIKEEIPVISKNLKINIEMKKNHDLITDSESIFQTENLDLFYGEKQALSEITFKVQKKKVTALIGPSGCGKSTLIRCFNRMNDVIDGCKIQGTILYHDTDIFSNKISVTDLRTRVGMIFQKPNPFPMSIYDNIAYGPRIHGIRKKKILDQIVETSLKKAVLWDEVNDRLNDSAMGLSGGQQQRLCIARALAVEPDVLLMDEPTSALDPIATSKIEDLINDLKENYTVIIVTHNMQQAARISDFTGFMYLGKMIEFDKTRNIFENPQQELTERYITGRFG